MGRELAKLQEVFSDATQHPSEALREGMEWFGKAIPVREAGVVAQRGDLKRTEEKLRCHQHYFGEYEIYVRKYRSADWQERGTLKQQWAKVQQAYQQKGLEPGYWKLSIDSGTYPETKQALEKYIAVLAQETQTRALALEASEIELKRLRADWQDLQRPRYPEKKEWRYAEVHQEISRVYRQLVGIHSTLRKGLKELVAALRVTNAPETDQASRVLALNVLLLRACRLTLDLQVLYAIRQELWAAQRQEMKSWERSRISVEVQKYARDLNDLVPDELLLPHDEVESLIPLPPRELAMYWPLYLVFREQRRFLEDAKFELEELLATPKANHAPDQLKRIIEELARLQEEMREQIRQNPEMEKDIKNLYGRMIDDLRDMP